MKFRCRVSGRLAAFLAVAAVAWGGRAAEPMGPISGDYEVTVASGATETWAGVVSGTGRIVKKGNGTLVLAAANDFTGGIQIDAGVVQVDNAGALGSGRVTLTPAAATEANVCQLFVNCSGTFTNDIYQTADGYVNFGQAKDSNANLLIAKDTSLTAVFEGKIVATGDISIRPQPSNTGNAAGAGPKITFNGDIEAAGKTVLLQSYGSPVVNGKVTCATFAHNNSWSGGGTITLGNAANAIGLIRIRYNAVNAGADGAFGGGRVTVLDSWSDQSNHASLLLNGTRQSLRSVTDADSEKVLTASTSCDKRTITSPASSTLVITGEETSRSAQMSLGGKVTLLVDAADYPDFVQSFDVRTSDTTGNLIVSNGTLKMTGTASFRNVQKIVVGPKGALSVESTAATALAGASVLAVDGAFAVTKADALPNDGSLVLELGPEASLTLPSGLVLEVASLTVGGVRKSAGTYGEEIGVHGGQVKVAAGVYTVNVPSGETRIVDEKLTGDIYVVKTGAGDVRLTNSENDFTGGVVINGGSLLVAGTNMLGTGAISINSTGSTTCQLRFTGNSMLTNAIVHTGTSKDDCPAVFVDKDVGEVVLTGDINSTGTFHFRHERRVQTFEFPAPGPTLILEGDITATGDVTARVYGEMHVRGKVRCSTFGGVDAYSAGGKMFVYPDGIDAKVMQAYSYFLYCTDAFVLTNRFVFNTRGWGNGGSRLLLQGHDQVVKSLTTEGTTRETLMAGGEDNLYHCVYSETGEAWLTISGELQCDSRETYASVNKGVSLRVDTRNNPNFVQTLNGRANLTTGEVAVVLGTLRLKDKACFKNVKRIFVGENGRLDASGMTVAPFPNQLESVEFEEGAQMVLPDGATVQARTVTVNGRDYASGTFTPETVPQLTGGVIVANGGVPSVSRWTGEVDERLSVTDNWDAEPDFVFGSTKASFGGGDGTALVDRAALFAGISFSQENGTGFSLTRDAAAHVLSFSDSVRAEASETPHRHVIDAPVRAYGTVVADAAEGQALVFKDAFTDETALTGRMNIGGAGQVAFEGENVIAGALRSTTSVWRVTGTLATPGHVDQGEPTYGGPQTVMISHPGGDDETKSGQQYGLCLSNAVVEKPIYVSNKIGRRAIWSMAGTTNEITGRVVFGASSWQPILTDAQAELTFSGGALFDHSFRPVGLGTVRFVNKPISALKSAGFNLCQGRVIVETTGNTFANVCIGYSSYIGKPTLEFAVSGAMTNGNLLVGADGGGVETPKGTNLGNGPYTLDVHATTQRCSRVAVTSVGVVTGEYPAMIEVFGGRAPGQPESFAVAGPVNGGVGFHMCGDADSVLTFANKAFASCGDLKVSSGTMEFANGATWPNGTNVTVCGTGTLKVAHRGVFRRARLDLSDSGKLDIPSGVVLSVKFATLNGKDVDPGTYATGALGGKVTGGGSLCVRGDGALLLVR